MAKAQEEKLVDNIILSLNQHWFNPALAAQMLIQQPIYIQDRMMDLMKEVIRLQSSRFDREWEHDQTSAGLMLASHLAEVIEMHEPILA
jgi:hypothetical protein